MNYRMTELQAAVARVQLERLPELIARRREMAGALTVALSSVDGVLPPQERNGIDSSWWVYSFRIDEERLGMPTREFADALIVEGLPLIHPYLPCPVFEQEALAEAQTYGESGYPYSEVTCPECEIEDYPGYTEFEQRQIGIFWSPHVRRGHIDEITAAVSKVAGSTAAVSGQDEEVES